MKDIECPYCDADIDINHDDGRGYEESILHQQTCRYCSKTFVFTTSISYDYEAEKADCLNGDEHDWKPTETYPREFSKMECSTCGEERQPTLEEKEKYNIPSPTVEVGQTYERSNNHQNNQAD